MESGSAQERVILLVLVCVGIALLIGGGLRSDLLQQLEATRAQEYLALAGGIFAFAALASRFVRARPVVVAAVAAAAIYVLVLGFAAVATVALLAACALAIGSLLVDRDAPAAPWLALVVGLGLVAGVVGWLLPFRVHFGPVYALVAFAIVVARRRAVLELVRDVRSTWRTNDRSPWLGALCIAAVASIASTTWLPTTQYDDVAYHLGLPWQLADYGRYRMDPASHVWALAPWSADVLQAIAQLIAGREVRGALNALYIVAMLQLVHTLVRRAGLGPRPAWLAVLLAGTQPMTAVLGFSMQTELPSAMVVCAAAVLAQSAARVRAGRDVAAVAVLFAFALGLKVSNVMFVAPLAVWFLLRWRPRRPVAISAWLPWREVPPAFALALVGGASSFYFAALLAGNPVLPLFNDVFGSPYFARDRYLDTRYSGMLGWDAPVALVTDTSRFFESFDGVAGFQWLVLLGPLLLALRDPRLRPLVAIGVVGVLGFWLQMQYLRYLYPALALLAVPLIGGFGRYAERPVVAALAIALATANVAYTPNAQWQFQVRPLGAELGSPQREREWLELVAPERLLARYVRERHGDRARVFYPDFEFVPGAELAGRAILGNWYDQLLMHITLAANEDRSGVLLRTLARELGASHVAMRPAGARPGLAAMVAAYGEPEIVVGTVALYRVPYEPLVPVREPVADGDLLRYTFALPTSGPVLVDTAVAARCAPHGSGVSAHWTFYRGTVGQKQQTGFARCDGAGRVAIRAPFDLRRAADRIELEIVREPRATLADVAVDVVARRDLATERELRTRLAE